MNAVTNVTIVNAVNAVNDVNAVTIVTVVTRKSRGGSQADFRQSRSHDSHVVTVAEGNVRRHL